MKKCGQDIAPSTIDLFLDVVAGGFFVAIRIITGPNLHFCMWRINLDINQRKENQTSDIKKKVKQLDKKEKSKTVGCLVWTKLRSSVWCCLI